MTDKRVWFITGAGRGMGVDFAKAALAAGYAVVATGRNTEAVRTAVGEAEDLLVVQLDVTSPGGTPRPRSRRRLTDSDASTCWSTTPPTSMGATSRN